MEVPWDEALKKGLHDRLASGGVGMQAVFGQRLGIEAHLPEVFEQIDDLYSRKVGLYIEYLLMYISLELLVEGSIEGGDDENDDGDSRFVVYTAEELKPAIDGIALAHFSVEEADLVQVVDHECEP